MHPTVTRPVLASLGYLVSAAAGAGLAVRDQLPGAFAGRTSGNDALTDFPRGAGTALSPPLPLLLLHGGCNRARDARRMLRRAEECISQTVVSRIWVSLTVRKMGLLKP